MCDRITLIQVYETSYKHSEESLQSFDRLWSNLIPTHSHLEKGRFGYRLWTHMQHFMQNSSNHAKLLFFGDLCRLCKKFTTAKDCISAQNWFSLLYNPLEIHSLYRLKSYSCYRVTVGQRVSTLKLKLLCLRVKERQMVQNYSIDI